MQESSWSIHSRGAWSMLLVVPAIVSGGLQISSSEVSSGRLATETLETAAVTLNRDGFVVLSAEGGLVQPHALVARGAEQARTDLSRMRSRLESVGIDADNDSFSFAEAVHRSRRRYDLSIDLRRTPPEAPWHELNAALENWATPVVRAAGTSELEQAVAGTLTSLPGAAAQRFHTDGTLAGSFNILCPLVDVGVLGTGTEFWIGSHRDPRVPELQRSGELAVTEASELPDGEAGTIVKPHGLAAGDLLVYDYRVVHRGPANPGPADRPIFYSVWADPKSAGDHHNFPRRSLAERERNAALFGLRGGYSAGSPARSSALPVHARGTLPPAHPHASTERCSPAGAVAQADCRVGDVLALYHAFHHGVDPHEAHRCLEGFFRCLPSDASALFLGPYHQVDPSDSPNCFLAPSDDGGQTRRLLAITPIRAGTPLAVPLAFDMDRHADMISAATSQAERRPGVLLAPGAAAHDVVRDAGDGKGRGVFAGRAYAAGEVVAEWPCRLVPDGDVPPALVDYMYRAPMVGASLVVFGHGMLYNHGTDSNVGWKVPTDADLLLTGDGKVQYRARRAICKGEEILINYGEAYWSAKGVEPR